MVYEDFRIKTLIDEVRDNYLNNNERNQHFKFTKGLACPILYKQASFTIVLHNSQYLESELLQEVYNSELLLECLRFKDK